MKQLNSSARLTIEELRQLIAASRASGIGKRSVDEIFAQAEQIAAARGSIMARDCNAAT